MKWYWSRLFSEFFSCMLLIIPQLLYVTALRSVRGDSLGIKVVCLVLMICPRKRKYRFHADVMLYPVLQKKSVIIVIFFFEDQVPHTFSGSYIRWQECHFHLVSSPDDKLSFTEVRLCLMAWCSYRVL
jgi:hypothetical protein